MIDPCCPQKSLLLTYLESQFLLTYLLFTIYLFSVSCRHVRWMLGLLILQTLPLSSILGPPWPWLRFTNLRFCLSLFLVGFASWSCLHPSPLTGLFTKCVHLIPVSISMTNVQSNSFSSVLCEVLNVFPNFLIIIFVIWICNKDYLHPPAFKFITFMASLNCAYK